MPKDRETLRGTLAHARGRISKKGTPKPAGYAETRRAAWGRAEW